MGVDEMGLNTEHFTFDAGSKLAELWTYEKNIALLRTTRPMWESHKVSQSTTYYVVEEGPLGGPLLPRQGNLAQLRHSTLVPYPTQTYRSSSPTANR